MAKKTSRSKSRKPRKIQYYKTKDNPLGYPGESIVAGIKNALTRSPSPQPPQQQQPAQPPAGSQRRNLRRRSRPTPQLPQTTTRQQRQPLVRPSPEEQLANRRAGGEPLRPYRQPSPPTPQYNPSFLERIENITPEQVAAGVKKYAPIVWKKAVRKAQDIDKGLEDYAARKKQEAIEHEREKARWWAGLTADEQAAILSERTKMAHLKEELRQKRSQYDQYAADRTMASLQGVRWTPKVYKISTGTGMFGDDSYKYVDEYGREVPEPAGEVFTKRSRSSKRTEVGDIESIFGASYSGKSSRRREYSPESDAGMIDTGRRRDRNAPSSPRSHRSETSEVMDLFR